MTSKDLFRELGGIDPELIMKAAPAEKPKKKILRNKWVKWGALAACFCLIVLGGVLHGMYRMDYFKENCNANIGTVADGVYYFEVPHNGIYSYEEASGLQKILSKYWYDTWKVNEYGIYYTRGKNLYVLPHDADRTSKLFSADRGSRVDFALKSDGAITVSEVGKKDGTYQTLQSLYLDGKTGDVLNNYDGNKTVYQIGERTITHILSDEGCDLLENGSSILPEGTTVGYSSDVFDDGMIFYVRSENHELWTLFIVFADGHNEEVVISGDPPCGLIGHDVLFVKDEQIWCLNSDHGEEWLLTANSDEYSIYEFVLDGEQLYSCVPWSDSQSYWKIIFDEYNRPVSLMLIENDITK